MDGTRLLFLTVTVMLMPDCAQCSGHVALRLTAYNNIARGKLLTGACCDGLIGSDCTSVQCDPYFVINITERNQQTQNINLQYRTKVLTNTEKAVFSDHIGSESNLFNGSINLWTGAMVIHVVIMDNNSDIGIPDGVISDLSVTVTLSGTQDNDTFFPIDFQPDNSILKAEINVQCDPGFTYDIYCYKQCQEMNNLTGHIQCDSSGTPFCLPGWAGDPTKDGCRTPTRCGADVCQNGGTCTPDHGTVRCTCGPGFTGRFCETSGGTGTSRQPLNPGGSGSGTTAMGAHSSAAHRTGSTRSGIMGTTPAAAGFTSSGGGGPGTTNGNSGSGNGAVGSTGNGNHNGGSGNTGGGSGNGGTTTLNGLTGGGGGGGDVTTGSGGDGTTDGQGQTQGHGGPQTGGQGHGNHPNGGNGSPSKHGHSDAESGDNGGNPGPIIGGVVGGLALLGLLALLLFLLMRKKRSKSKVNPEEGQATEEADEGTEERPESAKPTANEEPALEKESSAIGLSGENVMPEVVA